MNIAAAFEMLSCIPILIPLTGYKPTDYWTLLPRDEAASNPYLSHPGIAALKLSLALAALIEISITDSLPWL